MEKNTAEKGKNKTEKGKVIEMKQRETNEQDVKIAEVKAEVQVKMNEQQSELEMKIQQLLAETQQSMKDTEQKYQAKMNLMDNITDAVKTTVVTAGTVMAVGIMTSASKEVKLEELKYASIKESGEF